ncbi:hypothetical protein B0T17DRAFT_500487 [Bombardia bombarda]|uniref:Uncharacterized protein n=1 Tax=Bombardia bombarda TaxID=252184 RepID=A0AA39WBR8_9PEZI|nr:hypothetical protein B0T17DRAFT_500487 [Bombardia bombarda]
MPQSYFGRPEPDGRHLGSDLDLLAKWAHTFALRAPPQTYPLSQLSDSDKKTLFSKPAREFRLQHGPNNTIKLQAVQVDDGLDSDPDEEIDPEVAVMMRHENYHLSLQRHYDICCEIEDASDNMTAQVLEEAKRAGMDLKAAETKAAKAAHEHSIRVAKSVRARWKQDRLKALGYNTTQAISMDNSCFPNSPVGKIKTSNETLKTKLLEVLNNRDSTKDEADAKRQLTPPTKLPAHFTSAASSPAHGSETTVNSVSSSSPQYFGDDGNSSATSSASGFSVESPDSHGHNGGVFLANSMVYNTAPKVEVTTPTGHNVSGHLGYGLSQAFLNAPLAAVGKPPINHNLAANSVTAAQNGNTLATPTKIVTRSHASTSSVPVTSRSKLSIVDSTHPFPLAKEQPYAGITCYSVPFECDADDLVPLYWTTQAGKARYLQHKIHDLRTEDVDLRCEPKMGAVARNPIHVFVDLSNIIIGFFDNMKLKRGMPIQKRVNAPAFSFRNFDALMVRGRKVEKKVVAGSMGNSYNKRRPEYMNQAQRLNYEMNIMQRVAKPASPTKRKHKRSARELDSATSGPDSSDDYLVGPMKQGEQGVDELLHLKILQSAMDNVNRGTIVLATGDAAHAEYSDGFKKNIERALNFGWNIELYGWSRNISSAWHDPGFASKWGRQFRIIELDDFCEELFDLTIDHLQR